MRLCKIFIPGSKECNENCPCSLSKFVFMPRLYDDESEITSKLASNLQRGLISLQLITAQSLLDDIIQHIPRITLNETSQKWEISSCWYWFDIKCIIILILIVKNTI